MHRTEGPDYTTVGGKRRFKESAPATIVDKDIMNALQEEVCLAIENMGLTLRTTGALDESGDWGQLPLAILRNVLANIVGFGADPTGAADSKVAITAAFAASKIVYIPPGTFKIDSNVVVPEGGMLLGTGSSSIIKAGTASGRIITTNISCILDNFMIDGNGQTNYIALQALFNSATQRMHFRNLLIDDALQYIDTYAVTSAGGVLTLDNVEGINTRTASVFVGCSDGASKIVPHVYGNGLRCIMADDSGHQILAKALNTGDYIRRFIDCHFENGLIEVKQDGVDDSNVFEVINSDLYSLAVRMDGTRYTTAFRNNHERNVTWTPDYNSNKSFVAYIPPLNIAKHINGILVERNFGSSQTITTGTDELVNFSNKVLYQTSLNPDFQQSEPWSGATNRTFYIGPYGISAYIRLRIALYIDSDVDPDIMAWIQQSATINIASKTTGIVGRLIPVNVKESGKSLLVFNGLIERRFGRYFGVRFVNDTAGSVVILNTGSAQFVSEIEAEGL